MCTLAPRAALCFGATAGDHPLLKRPRAAVASMACGGMASAPAKRKVPAPALRLLGERMEAELDAVLGLLKKAELLSRNAAKTAAAAAGKEAHFLPTKKRKMPPSKATPEAAQKSKEPEKQQQPRDQRATPPTRKPPMAHLLAEAAVARARRREEIAREREKFRRELLEVERAALPDETIYPEDLEELGICEYVVTPTRKQARRGPG
ncbi:hypothetical protein ACP70R_035354 [Stipagrostis hirtigluma subsp. patula]